MNRKKQQYSGVVYSTSDDFEFQDESGEETFETLPASEQKLRIRLDKKARKGKAVTLVSGFVGTDEDLTALSQLLKRKCAVGGSVKEGEIVIQGDFRERISSLLLDQGYNVKMLG